MHCRVGVGVGVTVCACLSACSHKSSIPEAGVYVKPIPPLGYVTQRMNRDDRFFGAGLRVSSHVKDGTTILEPYDNVAVVYKGEGPLGVYTISIGTQAGGTLLQHLQTDLPV